MTEIIVAAIGSLGLVAVAWIGRRIDTKLGTPNGKGNVVQMLHKLLDGQTAQDTRLAAIETRQLDHELRLVALEQGGSDA